MQLQPTNNQIKAEDSSYNYSFTLPIYFLLLTIHVTFRTGLSLCRTWYRAQSLWMSPLQFRMNKRVCRMTWVFASSLPSTFYKVRRWWEEWRSSGDSRDSYKSPTWESTSSVRRSGVEILHILLEILKYHLEVFLSLFQSCIPHWLRYEER
jgi:hypothetical protein